MKSDSSVRRKVLLKARRHAHDLNSVTTISDDEHAVYILENIALDLHDTIGTESLSAGSHLHHGLAEIFAVIDFMKEKHGIQ